MTVGDGSASTPRRFDDSRNDALDPGSRFDDALTLPATTDELAGLSPLAELESFLAENEATRAPITLPVPLRPGIEIIYDPNIDGEMQLAVWRRRCQVEDKGRVVDFNPTKFATLIIASTCAGIKINGREVTVDGESLTFNHPRVKELVTAPGKPPAADQGLAARLMYGGPRRSGDGNMLETADEILEAAGYSPELKNSKSTADGDGDPTSAR